MVNGHMFLVLRGQCRTAQCDSQGEDDNQVALIRVSGLPTLYEVQSSYQPPTTISVLVPKHPNGLFAAESFSTYHGTITNPLDFSAAQPLKCNYAEAAPPEPGGYLTVPDTTPDPDPGEVTWLLTAVTSPTGETRMGRKVEAGVLSGRDPLRLPECTP